MDEKEHQNTKTLNCTRQNDNKYVTSNKRHKPSVMGVSKMDYNP